MKEGKAADGDLLRRDEQMNLPAQEWPQVPRKLIGPTKISTNTTWDTMLSKTLVFKTKSNLHILPVRRTTVVSESDDDDS